MIKTFLLSITILLYAFSTAQTDSAVYFKFTTGENRAAFYKKLVNNSIAKNLSSPLNNGTEDKWMDAFSAIELINYWLPYVKPKIKIAADSLQNRSFDFQQALLEMLYAGNHKEYVKQVTRLFNSTINAKIFAISAEYLLMADTGKKNFDNVLATIKKIGTTFHEDKDVAIITALTDHVKERGKNKYPGPQTLKFLFAKKYLPRNVVVYSIQRKNRNYPGLAIIKDTSGNFLLDSAGSLMYIPQLARSVSNMPFYITNGNTPQGIFRLYGFDRSKSLFIGPTDNLQLTIPYETSPNHFLKDSTITDTTWSKEMYARLLPKQLKNYNALYEAYHAGAAGRTEIIAHGTAVDPDFYKGQPYYPFTPTAGCLCTKEIWDAKGKRIISDQQKLADAVKKAGGPDGYLIVIDINDEQKAVSPEDILPYLK